MVQRKGKGDMSIRREVCLRKQPYSRDEANDEAKGRTKEAYERRMTEAEEENNERNGRRGCG